MSGGLALFLVCVGFVVLIVVSGKRRLARQREAELAAMPPEEREEFLKNEIILNERAREERIRTEIARREGVRERARERQEQRDHGVLNPVMVCPHCAFKGKIRTKEVIQKKGVSGGKATAAVLTGGVSMLATGLSRKEKGTQAYCENCKNQWIF